MSPATYHQPNCYIYFYLDPFTWIPFYIGKGTGDRAMAHLRETKEKTHNIHKWRMIQKIRKSGGEPIVIKWREGLTHEEAFELEEALIITFGRCDFDRDGCLTNICIGGAGSKGVERSEETRMKLSKSHTGLKHSDETRRVMSETRKGRKHSEESRKKISESHTGMTHTEESKRKISEASKKFWMGYRIIKNLSKV